jgi:hypothetical protein
MLHTSGFYLLVSRFIMAGVSNCGSGVFGVAIPGLKPGVIQI